MPPMPPRVASIKRAIETREDYSTLANGGEAEVFKYARSIGMRGGELVIQWQQAYRQRQAQATKAEGNVPLMGRFAARPSPVKSTLLADDLDRWADEPTDEPDDDDELDPVCGACNGTGKDSAGNVCKACGGSGKATVNDDQEEDQDDEEQDDE